LLDKSQLNADQIETISRKSEVNGNIKELEGILEQVLAFEKLVTKLLQLMHCRVLKRKRKGNKKLKKKEENQLSRQ
jgi:hypothetical protein